MIIFETKNRPKKKHNVRSGFGCGRCVGWGLLLSTARGWLQAALICLLLPPCPPPLDEGSPKQWVAEKGPKTCPRYPLTLTLTLTVRLTHAFFVVCGDMGFHGVQHERNSSAYQFCSCQIGRHSCFFRDGTPLTPISP